MLDENEASSPERSNTSTLTGPFGTSTISHDQPSRQQTFASVEDTVYLPTTLRREPFNNHGGKNNFLLDHDISSTTSSSLIAPPTAYPFAHSLSGMTPSPHLQMLQQTNNQRVLSPNVSSLQHTQNRLVHSGSNNDLPCVSECDTSNTSSNTTNQNRQVQRSTSASELSNCVSCQSSASSSNNSEKQKLELASARLKLIMRMTSSRICLNESTDQQDVSFQIDVIISSNQDGDINGSLYPTYTTTKWYSELKDLHDQIESSLVQSVQTQKIEFPMLNITEGSSLNDYETKAISNYLSSLSGFLSYDIMSSSSQRILAFFDDKVNSFTDKLKISILEQSLHTTTTRCSRMEVSLYEAEKNISRSFNMIKLLEEKIHDMEANKNRSRNNNDSLSKSYEHQYESKEINPLSTSTHYQSSSYDTRNGLYISKESDNMNSYEHSTSPAQMNPWQGFSKKLIMTLPSVGRQSAVMPWNMFPSHVGSSFLGSRMDAMLNLIGPNINTETTRDSIISFLVKQIKVATVGLFDHFFPIGNYSMKTYLPDDSSQIAVIVCHERENSWISRVMETLRNLVNVGGKVNDDIGYKHSISEVVYLTQEKSRIIRCVIDGHIVDVYVNGLQKLCEAAFLEHCDGLFGKHHIFKKSLLLLKAWWKYEANQGKNYSHLLNDTALSTMLLAVMNRYHFMLTSPLQVMALFFHCYAPFDWSSHCVSVERVEDMKTLSPAMFDMENVEKDVDFLIGCDVIERYCTLNLKQREVFPNDVVTNKFSPFPSKPGSNELFHPAPMNIMHPLTKTNVISQSLSEDEASKISKAIEVGAHKMTKLLMEEKMSTNAGMGQQMPVHQRLSEVFSNYFGMSLRLYSEGWRPDCIVTSKLSPEAASSQDPFSVNHLQLCINMKVGTLVMHNDFTTSGLVSLTESVLAEKGPLPVGEVGKMLQEATANPHLSHILKEKYNGLKKFLEKFTDKFILSNDHPFNPHVYLRSCFNAEEQRLIETGSTIFLNSYKKTKKSRRNKGKTTIPWLNNVDPNQSTY